VGESHYQDVLWRVVGGRTPERVRVDAQAVLLTEPDNPYDPNAVPVSIEARRSGTCAATTPRPTDQDYMSSRTATGH
jgi:hypothetical protein